MQHPFQDLWLVLLVGTTVILILFFSFIFTLFNCNRRLRKIKAPNLTELKSIKKTLIECQKHTQILVAEGLDLDEREQQLVVKNMNTQLTEVIGLIDNAIG